MENQYRIKVKSLAWIEQEGCLFVGKWFDSVRGEHFFRPIGGTVEFGESTQETLLREMLEETKARVEITAAPLILENIFVCDGKPGHEIVYLYPTRFFDNEFEERKTYRVIEDNGKILDAQWIPVTDFLNGTYRLVPEAFLDWLKENH
jgi:8-oxo-dGTP pyrophosphatase MutT (NUDIX family)